MTILTQIKPAITGTGLGPAVVQGGVTRWNGIASPLHFGDEAGETLALRYGAGLTDLSPLRRFYICGRGAAAFLDRLVTISIGTMGQGDVVPAPICDSRGRIVALAQITRLSETDFMIGADVDLTAWFEDASGTYEIQVTDLSEHYAAIGLYGPRGAEVLEAAGTGLGCLEPGQMANTRMDGAVLLVRHVGEWCCAYGLPDAYEIWVQAGAAPTVWQNLMGALPDVMRPVGRGTLDRERTLMGRALMGSDYESVLAAPATARMATPLDLGWDGWVSAAKPFFSGRTMLLEGAEPRLARLDVAGTVTRGAMVLRDGVPQGRITSLARCPLGGEIRALALCDGPVRPGGCWQVEGADAAGPHVVAAALSTMRAGLNAGAKALAQPVPKGAGMPEMRLAMAGE